VAAADHAPDAGQPRCRDAMQVGVEEVGVDDVRSQGAQPPRQPDE